MSLLTDVLFSDLWTTFISLIIGYVVYKLLAFYLKAWSLPPGPIPLPIIGNILLFSSKVHWDDVLKNLAKRYGPVFTFWMGDKPVVIISDIDIAREAFFKNELSGRPTTLFGSYFSNDKYQDVAFTDCGPLYEALRNVTKSAAVKFSKSDKLAYLISDCVDKTVKLILDKEGVNKEFSTYHYIYLIFLNIMAETAFGKNHSMKDVEFKKMEYLFKDFLKEAGSMLAMSEFSPVTKLFYRKMVKILDNTLKDFNDITNENFIRHYEDYNESIERDFCDALITAKNNAIEEGKDWATYLTDPNLAMCVYDMLIASISTSQHTLAWIVLFIAYYPDLQKRLKKEIESEIGDRIATHEDRNRCHYVMAFITEIMRLRNVSPTAIPHKAMVNCRIGDYRIPKGNGVIVYQGMILTDEKYWPNPKEFTPERFLENGEFITTRPKAYIPFGVGRRSCLGEKMAIIDLFLVLVRFLQMTNEYDITLGTSNGLEPDPEVSKFCVPKEHKIILMRNLRVYSENVLNVSKSQGNF